MISNKIIAKESFMELVYLWVEDYKNIQKQGFNFSPRFRCEYDEETKELNIIDKDVTGESYSKNFFGKNINVTAIVGENGSGKSSIQELLFLIIYLQYQQLHKDFNLTQIFQFEKLNKDIFLIVYYEAEGLKKLYLKDIIIKTITEDEILREPSGDLLQIISNNIDINLQNIPSLSKINFYSIYFNYTFDTWNSPIHITTWIEKLYHRRDNYNDIPLLLEPNKTDRQIDIKNISYLNMQRMFRFYSELFDKTKSIKKYFVPNIVYFQLNIEKIIKKIENHMYKIRSSNEEAKKLASPWVKYLNDIKLDNDLISINKVYLLFKISEHKINTNIEESDDLLCVIKYLVENLKNKNPKDYIDNLPMDKMNSLSNIFSEKILDCINFHNVMNHNIELQNKYKKLLDKENNLLDAFKVYDRLIPWINVMFYDNGKNYNSLSTGEKTLLNFSINMLYQIHNIFKNENYDSINLFLDEVELTMHPQWQKRFLTDILNYLQLFSDKKFNLILISHSPVILSDLPKQNVIFLEKDEKTGNCMNATDKVDINPFGANIHTLLSHGFFMKDGFMGEFAKEKIDLAIKYLNQKILTPTELDYCENIISIIGEPIIKRELQRMLDSKRLSKIDKIDEIEKQIEELQKELKKIKND